MMRTNRLAGYAAFATLITASIAWAQPPVAQWMRINDKQIGISVLMPPGAAVEPKGFADPKTGTKIASLQARAEQKGVGGYFYMTMVFRVNEAGAATLDAKTKGSGDALATLVMKPITPLLEGMKRDVQAHPKEATMTRVPITMLGMPGEKIDATRLSPKTHHIAHMQVRILKNEENVVVLLSGADKTTKNEAAAQTFFDSFKLSPQVPFDSGKAAKSAQPAASR